MCLNLKISLTSRGDVPFRSGVTELHLYTYIYTSCKCNSDLPTRRRFVMNCSVVCRSKKKKRSKDCMCVMSGLITTDVNVHCPLLYHIFLLVDIKCATHSYALHSLRNMRVFYLYALKSSSETHTHFTIQLDVVASTRAVLSSVFYLLFVLPCIHLRVIFSILTLSTERVKEITNCTYT